MPVLVISLIMGIYVLLSDLAARKAWMAGTSPVETMFEKRLYSAKT